MRRLGVLFLVAFVVTAPASERERGLLLGGVTELEFGKSVPGVLEVSAPAFPILEGLNGEVMGAAEASVNLIDVYVVKGQEVTGESDQAGLKAFREAGGGLVVAATPWAFAKKYPNFASEFPGNRMIAGSGIVYSKQGTAKTGGLLAIQERMPEGASTSSDSPIGMRAVSAPLAAAKSILEGGNTMPKAERAKAIEEMAKGAELTGAEAAAFWEALREMDEKFGPVVPTKTEPLVLGEDPLRDAIVTLQDQLAMTLPAADLQLIAAASEYPGAVPTNAERVVEKIVIATAPRNAIGGGLTSYLVSTGFYAAPGEVVKIRDYPGPTAELASSRVVLTLPSEYVRKLENPDEVMELWNEILDGAAQLLVIDRDEIRPERIVVERQLALGAMHSGYPIGTHTGSFPEIAVDAKRLRAEGNWGIFHEIGHNHQRPMWYLPGTTETTCNLWSLYLHEKLIGNSSENTHKAVQPLNRRQTFMNYINGGKNFEKDWNVWTALETYMQLQEAFGWEAFQEVFDEYNMLADSERPKEQQEKNDEWMVRFSKRVGRNLGPFFRAWNIPVTEKAVGEVSSLPDWGEDPMVKYR